MEMNQTIGVDPRLQAGGDIAIRSINDLRSGAETLIKNFRFDGLNILRCYEGRYKIKRKGCPSAYLEKGEVFIVYPGHVVTVVAQKPSNRLVYGVFTGKNVADYFNALGCFDGLHSVTLPRYESVIKLRELMKPGLYQTAQGRDACLSYLSDIVASIVGDARANGNAFVFDVIGQIRENLTKGVVRLQNLCDELNVSRAYLHHAFRNAGLGCISDFIKAEQLQRALWLLRNTSRPIAEVAKAAGFISVTHFSTFVKKRVGRSPRELR